MIISFILMTSICDSRLLLWGKIRCLSLFWPKRLSWLQPALPGIFCVLWSHENECQDHLCSPLLDRCQVYVNGGILTPTSDEDWYSPYTINTMSSKQVMRKKKVSIRGLLVNLHVVMCKWGLQKSPERKLDLESTNSLQYFIPIKCWCKMTIVVVTCQKWISKIT